MAQDAPDKEPILDPGNGMIVQGIFASEAIDSSAELLKIDGLDISTLVGSPANTEHNNATEQGGWSNIVGKIITAKKIFTEDDCEDQDQRFFWRQLELPFLYGQVRLYDMAGHQKARELAAIIRDAVHAGEPPSVGFSIEGSTVQRDGHVIKRSIGRAVAITIRPCNKSAVLQVVSDPAGPPLPSKKEQHDVLADIVGEDAKKFQQDGHERLGGHTGQYNPVVRDQFAKVEAFQTIKQGLQQIRQLVKTTTAGMPTGAPSTLTGGAALQREHVGSTIKAAIRDWNAVAEPDFRKFLKHRLPDVSDKFIDRFADIVHDVRIRRSLLKKTDAINHFVDSLTKAEPAVWQGHEVEPGEVQIKQGERKGQKAALMFQDATHHYVKFPKDHAPVKLKNEDKGIGFDVTKPHVILHSNSVVRADRHGLPGFDHPAQQELIDGIDLNRRIPIQNAESGMNEGRWHQNGAGQTVWVKPSTIGMGQLVTDYVDYPEKFSLAQREAAVHTLARDFFGLGDHVPETAAFKHPGTGEHHSAQKRVEQGEHFKSKRPDHVSTLMRLGATGTLDKLALFDMMMGNQDRHAGNYMMTAQHPGIHLIDNGFSLSGDRWATPRHPHYWDAHARLTGDTKTHHDEYGPVERVAHQHALHPEAAEWLGRLNPMELKERAERLGVPPDLVHELTRRLQAVKNRVERGPVTKQVAFFAPFMQENE